MAGPLNLPRTPQGRPVLVQAGSSDIGRRFAARHAEAVFTAHMEKTTAQEFYADLKRLVAEEGRKPEQVLILPGLSPMIASTQAEAERMTRETNELSDPEVGRKRLSGRFGGHDFSHLPLDRPLTPEDFPDPGSVQAARSRTEVILSLVRREKPTLRQLLANLAGARGHFTFAGTPEQVADIIEDWFSDGAADGFNIMPPLLPAMLDVFSAEVIPILQKRGLFRTAYEGKTLARALRPRLAGERVQGSGAPGGLALAHEPVAVMRRGEVELGAERHDAGRVHLALAAVVVPLDVIDADGLGDARHLIEIAEIIRQVRVVGDAAQVALEVAVIDRVEADQRGEQPPVGFGHPRAGEIALPSTAAARCRRARANTLRNASS